MAPEQAQGLDTLDQRADVWALAAIAYECVAGTVPFKGANGPSILLEILTKEPALPSVAGNGQKHPIPPSVDRAILSALKKTAALRTPSVGAFADQLGQAYGLEGDHVRWSAATEGELDEEIAAKLPALLNAAPPAPQKADAADSFFGEDDSLGAGMDAALAQPGPGSRAPQSVPQSSHRAAADPAPTVGRAFAEDGPFGIPTSGGVGWWLVPVVVAVALVAGALIAWLL
jgi:serine/threonine-protein kinase